VGFLYVYMRTKYNSHKFVKSFGVSLLIFTSLLQIVCQLVSIYNQHDVDKHIPHWKWRYLRKYKQFILHQWHTVKLSHIFFREKSCVCVQSVMLVINRHQPIYFHICFLLYIISIKHSYVEKWNNIQFPNFLCVYNNYLDNSISQI
jgi:hypothetical protein